MHKLFSSNLVLLLSLHAPSSAMHNHLNRASDLLSSKYAAAAGAILGFASGGQSAVAHTHVESKTQKIEILQKTPSFEQKQAIKKEFCDRLLASASGAIAKQYLAEFAAEQESLKQELYTLANVKPEEFQKRFVGYYNYYSKQQHIPCPTNIDAASVRVIEQSNRQHIDAVLDKTGIDKKLINFVYCKYTEPHCGFGAGFNTVFIDPSKIPNDENLYKSILAHELTHVIFDDWIISAVTSSYCSKEQEDLKNKYQRLKEKRADILGCFLSPEYAHAKSFWYSDMTPWHGPPTHPEHSIRAAYLYKLYTQTDPDYIEREARCQKERQDLFYGFVAA